MTEPDTIIIDIGKTNLKISVGAHGQAPNPVSSVGNMLSTDGPYPHYDVNSVWQWLLHELSEAAKAYPLKSICVAAHGASAALVGKGANDSGTGLTLPVMDYEWVGVREVDEAYDKLRPSFSESLSPALPAGLNLGRQIFWQSKNFPKHFAQTDYILPYPQYWSWRLCGVAASEVSSLGCHTDLWAPRQRAWSSLVQRMGWEKLFAPITESWRTLGHIRSGVSEMTGLDADCLVAVGVHDSNASFAFFGDGAANHNRTVVSTGTWAVTMAPGVDLEQLDESRDMLANVDVTGAPVGCARFMGGREFSEICSQTGSAIDDACTIEDICSVIENQVYALPDFSKGSGPFGGRQARIIGDVENGVALATLYSALMVDFELDLLGVEGEVVIEGSFAENSLLCGILSALQSGRRDVRISRDGGVAAGCLAMLSRGKKTSLVADLPTCAPRRLPGLKNYRDAWRKRCGDVNTERKLHA